MRVRDAAMLMIIISDNSATNMVIDLMGLDYINEQLHCLGLERTTIFQRLGERAQGLDARTMSVSTAAEMAKLLALIARHEAVSSEASEDMLRILRRQDYRNELSRELPWNEMNMLPDYKQNWVAEKGGAFLNGIRASGAIFHGAQGNVLIGKLGYAAWRALAAPATEDALAAPASSVQAEPATDALAAPE